MRSELLSLSTTGNGRADPISFPLFPLSYGKGRFWYYSLTDQTRNANHAVFSPVFPHALCFRL